MLLRKEEENKQEYDQRIRKKAESSRAGELNAAIHLTVFDAILKAEKKKLTEERKQTDYVGNKGIKMRNFYIWFTLARQGWGKNT